MGDLLSGGTCNNNESQPDEFQGKLPGVFPEKAPGGFPGELPGRFAGKVLGRKDWLNTQA
jgi:hypothetical protein